MAVRLFQSTRGEEQWSQIVQPWLRERKDAALVQRPTVILVPGRSDGFFWRSRVLATGEGLLGIRFWTPSDVRKFLLEEKQLPFTPATQTELALIARTCADRLARQKRDEFFLRAVARQPDDFLRGYDLLVSAGWDPVADQVPEARELAQAFRDELRRLERGTQAETHRALVTAEAGDALASLLIIGFNATHWPLWDLLRSTVAHSRHSTLSFIAPRVFAEKIDQLWISSWEDVTQVSLEVTAPEEAAAPFAALAEAYERGDSENHREEVTFLVARDLKAHASAIVRQALFYLSSGKVTRMGLVFPQANALAMEVAEQLRAQGIPLDEGTGFFVPTFFSNRSWSSWLDLQREWSGSALVNWARTLESEGIRVLPATARKIAKLLDGAWGETLVEDLDFLAAHLDKKTGQREKDLARLVREHPRLAEEGSFTAFFSLTLEALKLFGKETQIALLKSYAPHWKMDEEPVISRAAYLDWLREATAPRERKRGEEGNHFYGKVHLLTYAQVSGQNWSHLILAQMNEKIWPPSRPLGEAETWKELNRRALRLNQKGIAMGSQGQGHEVVIPGRGYGLTTQDKEDMAWRDLCSAVQEVGHELCLTASLAEAGRRLVPNDYFIQFYQGQTGQRLDDDTLQQLAQLTERESVDKQTQSRIFPEPRHAYLVRRDATKPFGPYEFAFQQPPLHPVQLSCKEWEEALRFPAASWLRHVVGVAPWPEDHLPWSRAIGTWAHLWLEQALRSKAIDSKVKWKEELREECERFRVKQEKEAQLLKQELPAWWPTIWSQATRITEALAEVLDPVLPGWRVHLEKKLPVGLKAELPGTESREFLFRGQPDLVLEQENLSWVLDFKTGRAPKLKPKADGTGLQVILYALALQEAGAAQVRLSLVVPAGKLEPEKEMYLGHVDRALYRSLDLLHRAGIFGQLPVGEYGPSRPLPMTTLVPDDEILMAKWEMLRGEPEPEEET